MTDADKNDNELGFKWFDLESLLCCEPIQFTRFFKEQRHTKKQQDRKDKQPGGQTVIFTEQTFVGTPEEQEKADSA